MDRERGLRRIDWDSCEFECWKLDEGPEYCCLSVSSGNLQDDVRGERSLGGGSAELDLSVRDPQAAGSDIGAGDSGIESTDLNHFTTRNGGANEEPEKAAGSVVEGHGGDQTAAGESPEARPAVADLFGLDQDDRGIDSDVRLGPGMEDGSRTAFWGSFSST